MSTKTAINGALGAFPPAGLASARSISHKAAQLLTVAARANVDAVPDDSHSNLGWDSDTHRFLSQPLPGAAGPIQVALSLSPLAIYIVDDGKDGDALMLGGSSYANALQWLDSHLDGHGLQSATDVAIPYDLPEEAALVTTFESAQQDGELSALAAWFDLAAHVLTEFAETHGDIEPGPSMVRCWPHHFDIATYVQLESGDFEDARGIGVGMSPGDETYGQPYFYINPWPHLDPADLPALPDPGHWHTEGFVGAVATADEVLSVENPEAGLTAFVESAFAAGRGKLGV